MTQRLEVPVTTLADGTSLVCIIPESMPFPGYAANGRYLPFLQIAPGLSTNPYTALGLTPIVGPFSGQSPNI
jgi:hypothetical protein